jgi:hypothetical protein
MMPLQTGRSTVYSQRVGVLPDADGNDSDLQLHIGAKTINIPSDMEIQVQSDDDADRHDSAVVYGSSGEILTGLPKR